jgi:toluene monooxygenase system ferredoxin subunit
VTAHSEVAVCAVCDLWQGDVIECQLLDGRTAIVLNIDGEIHAYDSACPHQGTALSADDYDEGVLTCPAHMWEFDARTGRGINPRRCQLTPIAVSVRDGVIFLLSPTSERAVPCR